MGVNTILAAIAHPVLGTAIIMVFGWLLGLLLGFFLGYQHGQVAIVRRLLKSPKLGAGYYAVHDEAERLGIR